MQCCNIMTMLLRAFVLYGKRLECRPQSRIFAPFDLCWFIWNLVEFRERLTREYPVKRRAIIITFGRMAYKISRDNCPRFRECCVRILQDWESEQLIISTENVASRESKLTIREEKVLGKTSSDEATSRKILLFTCKINFSFLF